MVRHFRKVQLRNVQQSVDSRRLQEVQAGQATPQRGRPLDSRTSTVFNNILFEKNIHYCYGPILNPVHSSDVTIVRAPQEVRV